VADPTAPQPFDIQPVTIEEELKRSYLDYAMSVIVSRALPDVRDGLKPVHRRILFGMNQEGNHWNRAYRKSARVVGDVMGKYHPHGDLAIYDTIVRMAQDFSMRLTLVDGQGNFGSMDGDPPAAMRYTEIRLARAAHALLDDIDKQTVDFTPNYDETTEEPVVLPAKFPNLLVNGAGGIAVGMATNIPTHNLGEVIDACLAYIDNPEITTEELIDIVPGPDFPTGGLILGRGGIRSAYHTGRGSIIMRGRTKIEEIRKDREAIIVTEVPYQVNKARMLERIGEMVREKRIDGIAELRDESDRDGVRVVIELRRDAMSEIVLNQLYRYTPLQTSFGINALALDHGKPEMLGLKQIIAAFVEFREEVIRRRTIYELGKARDRAHTLVGLAIAVANIDEVIALIRGAKDPEEARAELLKREWPAEDVADMIALIDDPRHAIRGGIYKLSEEQAKAILDLRLQRLTGLEREKIAEELSELATSIKDYLDILASRARVMTIMKGELTEMKEQFATPRRTEILDQEFESDIEDLIQHEDLVVTVTHAGYVKRVPLSSYRAQRRGGKGRTGMQTKEEDFVSRVFVCDTHAPVLFFSSRGLVYRLKAYQIPEGAPQSRGKALVNMLPLEEGEVITAIMPMPEDEATWDKLHVMFATARGNVRRNRLSDFASIQSGGKIAMKFEGEDEGDRMIGVLTCTEKQDVLLATKLGKCIRFEVTDVRVFSGRNSTGVRGIRLADGDEVISMSLLAHTEIAIETRDEYLRSVGAARRLAGSDYEGRPEDKAHDEALAAKLEQPGFVEMANAEEFILAVTERGYGKRTSAYEYRITNRGGQGITNIDTSERNGNVVAAFPVEENDQLVLVTNGGQIIRFGVDEIRIAGRSTQGVILFSVGEAERVVSVAQVKEVAEGGGGTITEAAGA
jgi:DNA gyrase subunit A